VYFHFVHIAEPVTSKTLVLHASMPVSIDDEDQVIEGQQQCVGTGARCMMNMCWLPKARAYAVALYVNMQAAQQTHIDALKNETDINASFVSARRPPLSSFERVLLGPHFAKTLRIVFCSDVSGTHIKRGFKK
jgi:hypothetical protein